MTRSVIVVTIETGAINMCQKGKMARERDERQR
jgi:hypothetical protein